MQLRENLGAQLGRRGELLDRVTEVLLADERVVRVELSGSLNGGKADEFSDIDLRGHLSEGVVDRNFFLDVPRLMERVGPSVVGWGFTALPDEYVATFHFDEYPLFWGVDIACVSSVHEDGSDLMSVYRWEQIYKMWILAAKYLARSEAKVSDVQRLVERHAEVTTPASTTAARLCSLLAGIEERKLARGDPYEALHHRCVALANSLR